MPRSKSPPTTTIHVRIEDSCLDAVRYRLGNPLTGNIPKGALAGLIQELLWDYVSKQGKP